MPGRRELGLRDLRADCANCFALCCVVPAFTASADFAVTKPAGLACANLQPDFRCGIHTRLRPSGFTGCTVYDCFGAGQKVSQVTYAGRDWRSDPQTAREMFQVFPVMRDLHELLAYLVEARALAETLAEDGTGAEDLRSGLDRALEELDELTRSRPETVIAVDVGARRQAANPLLVAVSERVRRAARTDQKGKDGKGKDGKGKDGKSRDGKARAGARKSARPKDHRGADLIGAKLKGADLRAADLRGAYLIGADLRDADLRGADLIGVDFRGADLRGADLTGSLFLVQSQLEAAKGNAATRLSEPLIAPGHWDA